MVGEVDPCVGFSPISNLAALPWRPRVLLTSVSDELAGGAEVDRSGAVDFIPKGVLGRAPLDLILGGAATLGRGGGEPAGHLS
jgi:hypothetical protein